MNIHGRDPAQAQPSLTEEGEPPVDVREATRQVPSSSSGNRVVPAAANRRRHSSHGIEAQYRAPDRVARSVSPPMGFGSIAAHLRLDDESDNDILRLWRGREHNDEASTSDDDSESDDGTDGPSDAEDDEEEDDDDEIILIGHR
ncbi:hypothetical protein G7Z17_g10011 [Cylindrodendrum hubeiense]|uniref:Uncharacterized protein n=1 Tax=Cylindrodendrum hubeiense TaxID=595255 RepID=A0A9P5H3H1_9HYPO|nr:hypothetical protein G7Z17_g10011 [Cylindrodendrum hubeiense]